MRHENRLQGVLQNANAALAQPAGAIERMGVAAANELLRSSDEVRFMREKLTEEEAHRHAEVVAERQRRLDVDLRLARLQAELAVARNTSGVRPEGDSNGATLAECLALSERTET